MVIKEFARTYPCLTRLHVMVIIKITLRMLNNEYFIDGLLEYEIIVTKMDLTSAKMFQKNSSQNISFGK